MDNANVDVVIFVLGGPKMKLLNKNTMDALPDDILPLIAAGSNWLLATMRVSRRLAAVCAVPLLERDGVLLRRGRFMLDLAAKYDAGAGGPVLDINDMATLWEIAGVNKVGITAYRAASVCEGPVLNPDYFSGLYHGGTVTGSSRLYISGLTIDYQAASHQNELYYLMHLTHGAAADYYVVVNTGAGRRYWTGPKRAVMKIAKLVDSVVLTLEHFCGCIVAALRQN